MQLKSLEEQVVQSYGMEYKNFQKYFVLSQVPDEVLAIREEVSEAIKEELQIEHYYKAIEIKILDDFISCECLSDSEITRVCLERFSRLTFQKVNKASYQNEFSYAEKFHYLALLIFMKVMNPSPDTVELLVAEHRAELAANLTDEEYEAMVRSAFISEPKPLGFGNHGEFNQGQLAHH